MMTKHGIALSALCSVALLWAGIARAHPAHEHRRGPAETGGSGPGADVKIAPADLRIPALPLVNQDGTRGLVKSDWIGDRIVVVDFIFTTCPLVCPLLSAVMVEVQERLGDAVGKEVRLVSISVDPLTDIPPRLREYAKKYGAGPGWEFLTGEKPDVDKVLKAFGAYTPDAADHPPMFLVGDARTGRWTRVFGIPSPDRIVGIVNEYRAARAAEARSAAPRNAPLRLDEGEQRKYFTDLPLVNQDGREVSFYTDLLKGRVVLVSFFYTNCTDVCPILMPNLAEVQRLLGDRFGRDVFFVSISVDPEDDTPEAIREYGERFGAKPGWTLLTGRKENIDRIVGRLGQYAEDFEDHSILFLLGDVRNARWMKIRGDSPPELVAASLLDLLKRK